MLSRAGCVRAVAGLPSVRSSKVKSLINTAYLGGLKLRVPVSQQQERRSLVVKAKQDAPLEIITGRVSGSKSLKAVASSSSCSWRPSSLSSPSAAGSLLTAARTAPFNAQNERWNGRAAMIGLIALLVTENIDLKGPLLGFIHNFLNL